MKIGPYRVSQPLPYSTTITYAVFTNNMPSVLVIQCFVVDCNMIFRISGDPLLRLRCTRSPLSFIFSHLSFHFCPLLEFLDNCRDPAGGGLLRQRSDSRRGDSPDEGNAAFHAQTSCLTQSNKPNPDRAIYNGHGLISGQTRPGPRTAVLNTTLLNCKMVSHLMQAIYLS